MTARAVGPSHCEVTQHPNEDGTCLIEYVPEISGDYVISVLHHGKHLAGSPYTVRAVLPYQDIGKARRLSMQRQAGLASAIMEEVTAKTQCKSAQEKVRYKLHEKRTFILISM